jgi:hypothetical protein
MDVEGDCEVMARKELGCAKKTSYVIWNYHECDKFVARIRLVKYEDPSACVTVNWKVLNSDSAVLPVVPSCVCTSIRSQYPIQNPSSKSRTPPYTWQYLSYIFFRQSGNRQTIPFYYIQKLILISVPFT